MYSGSSHWVVSTVTWDQAVLVWRAQMLHTSPLHRGVWRTRSRDWGHVTAELCSSLTQLGRRFWIVGRTFRQYKHVRSRVPYSKSWGAHNVYRHVIAWSSLCSQGWACWVTITRVNHVITSLAPASLVFAPHDYSLHLIWGNCVWMWECDPISG